MSYQSILQMVVSGVLPSILISICLYLIYYTYKKQHSIAIGCLISYLCMLFYVTIYRYGIHMDEFFMQRPKINLQPLISTLALYHNGGLLVFLYNIVGNILWFFPFGYLLPMINSQYRFLNIAASSFLLSLGIEILQYMLNCGISDVDDIIFNLFGGCIGYVAYKMTSYLKKRGK